MPNRLPACPICGPRKRHLPENCPILRKTEMDGSGDIRNGLNGIPDAIATLKRAISILEAMGRAGA